MEFIETIGIMLVIFIYQTEIFIAVVLLELIIIWILAILFIKIGEYIHNRIKTENKGNKKELK